jgi:5'(3')-deoxyribonucleotidase
MRKFFPGLTREQIMKPLEHGSFWESIPLINGMSECLARLSKEGYRIKVVTAPCMESMGAMQAKVKRLIRDFPVLTLDDIYIVGEKKDVIGDVIVDDAYHNLGGDRKLRLMKSMSYNLNIASQYINLVRYETPEEIYKAINKRFGERCIYHMMPEKDRWQYCVNCEDSWDDDGGLFCKRQKPHN